MTTINYYGSVSITQAPESATITYDKIKEIFTQGQTAENEALKRENQILKSRLAELERQVKIKNDFIESLVQPQAPSTSPLTIPQNEIVGVPVISGNERSSENIFFSPILPVKFSLKPPTVQQQPRKKKIVKKKVSTPIPPKEEPVDPNEDISETLDTMEKLLTSDDES
jgi:hypothetical protein